MAKNSRGKGKEGELELSHELSKWGFSCRRGQQFRGGGDSPDVIGLPGVHIECKRVERLLLDDAMEQSRRDAKGTGDIPVVMHRRNRKPWKVTMDLADFMNMYVAATCDSACVSRFPAVNSNRREDVSLHDAGSPNS